MVRPSPSRCSPPDAVGEQKLYELRVSSPLELPGEPVAPTAKNLTPGVGPCREQRSWWSEIAWDGPLGGLGVRWMGCRS